jgi:nitrogen regulatory protein P-II 1
VYLLITVLNNEELLNDLITGWLDIGITGATVIESTDSLQLISHHIPIFAGFRSLTSGGMPHNKTVFTIIRDKEVVDQAIACLEALCSETGKPFQGIYVVAPALSFGRLGRREKPEERQRHMEKKIGRLLKEHPPEG